MKLSARNQFKGIIIGIEIGAVNGIVKIAVGDEVISATISKNAIEELELREGAEATAIVKATEVLIATGELKISARNQLKGTVISVTEGAVNGIVCIKVSPDITVSSTISMAAIKDLALVEGTKATAIIKATSVMIAC